MMAPGPRRTGGSSFARSLAPNRLLFPSRRRELVVKTRLYDEVRHRADIERRQVERFNATWSYCLSDIPFYRSWQREHGLPDRISHPSDLHAFPALDKTTLVERSEEIFQRGAITDAYTTGGSSGEPARYPRGAKDDIAIWSDAYTGRGWWGIRPFDPHVVLWGHSHLFGTGLRGRLAHARRRVADGMLDITRLNAYDLTDDALRADYASLRTSDPVFLVGYTSAVFRLARFIDSNGLTLERPRRLRGVILTAETVSDADIALVERVFEVPAIIEYGAAETGAIAYSRGGSRPLQVLWDSFVCLVDSGGGLRVTTTAQRLFPLVNYAIGDVVQPSDVEGGNALGFDAVLGRAQDVVEVATVTGAPLLLSAIMPVHVLKSWAGVTGIQFRQHDGHRTSIFLRADSTLDLDAVSEYFAKELRKDHPDFDRASVSFAQVHDEQKTRAGKHRLFRE
jgi:phenylacetate-coenzyme A ligase PaaK-like adenylate-forming protein